MPVTKLYSLKKPERKGRTIIFDTTGILDEYLKEKENPTIKAVTREEVENFFKNIKPGQYKTLTSL